MRSLMGQVAVTIAVVSLAGCEDRPPPPPPDTVALVGGRPITRGDLDRQLQRLPPAVRGRYAQPAHRHELIESLVGTELLALEAERLGFDRDPEFQHLAKQQLVNHLLRYTLDPAGVIPEAEVERYYRDNAAEFATEAGPRPLSEVRERIRQKLGHEARDRRLQALLGETRTRFKVEILDPLPGVKAAASQMATVD